MLYLSAFCFLNNLGIFQRSSSKQAKCLIKRTKPLVKKDEWNKYVEMWNVRANGQDKMENNNMESLMNVGIVMIGIGEKCNVTF